MAKSTTPKASATPRKPRAAKPTPAAPRLVPRDAPSTPLDSAEIAARAFEMFLERGAVHGHDLEHWLEAERDLRAQRLTSAA